LYLEKSQILSPSFSTEIDTCVSFPVRKAQHHKMAGKHALDGSHPPSKRAKTADQVPSTEKNEPDLEREVGITAYVSRESPRFECVVKQRYTDFLVNEILPNGTVLHLDQLPEARRRKHHEIRATLSEDVNEPPAKDGNVDSKDKHEDTLETISPAFTSRQNAVPSKDAATQPVVVPELSPEEQADIQEIFGEEVASHIIKLHAAVLNNPHKKARDLATIKSSIISEKSKRTQAHIAIRRIFKSRLQTETLQEEPGVIAIKAAPQKNPKSDGRGEQINGSGAIAKGKVGWDELGGEYLHFTLYKENKDTMEVLYFIASQLKIPVKNFQFAGTKDRRGVTVQRVAVFRVHANRIINLNTMAKGWVVGGFEYKKHGLELGELLGNEFTLTLRECCFDGDQDMDPAKRLERTSEVVSKMSEAFRTNGFLNYYGLQRFGTFSTGTHMTGMMMLQGDLEGAVNSILAYSPDLLPENQDLSGMTKVPQDDVNRADTIRIWRETGTLGHLPRRFQAEYAIMQYLSKKNKKTGQPLQSNDWQGALSVIQRNLRMMYVHAYQSLVWNTVASRRWELHGNRVIEGDLVIIGEKEEGDMPKDAEFDEDGEPIVRPAEHDQAPSIEDKFTRARPLSKEDVESGKYDIFDIVLPQPGYDVLYPANAIGKFYEEFMGSDEGGKLDPYNMRRTWKDVSLSGAYRKLMGRPLNGVDVQVREYETFEDQLVKTDLEKLRMASGAHVTADASGRDAVYSQSEIEENGKTVEGNGKKIAVVLKFQLGSSQYATMALRELTGGGAVAYKPDYSTTR